MWVIGQGGMLGSCIALQTKSRERFALWKAPICKFSWHDERCLMAEMQASLLAFEADVVSAGYSSWSVIWAAGAGTVSSSVEALQRETRVLMEFLTCLGRRSRLVELAGVVFFSSSAGAIYGASREEITESSITLPISEYGKQKLEQERAVVEFVARHSGLRGLLGRISNLYGENQNLHKPQGIISQVSRSIIRRSPVHIYVPIDTIRDFMHVNDCADQIVECLSGMVFQKLRVPTQTVVKIFASQRATTLAEIIGIFARIARQHPRIICSAHSDGSRHVRSVRFRSHVWPDSSIKPQRPLPFGIFQVHARHLLLHGKGQLP